MAHDFFLQMNYIICYLCTTGKCNSSGDVNWNLALFAVILHVWFRSYTWIGGYLFFLHLYGPKHVQLWPKIALSHFHIPPRVIWSSFQCSLIITRKNNFSWLFHYLFILSPYFHSFIYTHSSLQYRSVFSFAVGLFDGTDLFASNLYFISIDSITILNTLRWSQYDPSTTILIPLIDIWCRVFIFTWWRLCPWRNNHWACSYKWSRFGSIVDIDILLTELSNVTDVYDLFSTLCGSSAKWSIIFLMSNQWSPCLF